MQELEEAMSLDGIIDWRQIVEKILLKALCKEANEIMAITCAEKVKYKS